MSLPTRPRVCALLGPKKSGKTSILSVVLDDINPNSTVYNEPTRIPWTKRFDAFLDFEIWDMPGGMYELDRLPNFDVQNLGSVIFVIDAQAIQGDNVEQARKLANAIFRIHELNSAVPFEIFIHKVDAMSPEYRNDTRQVISDGIKDELTDLAEMEFASLSDYSYPVLNYHLTSIYQASVYEALSKVISSLMPCQGALERLLDVLSTNSNFDKAWLFDLSSKLYFATDSTPGDAITHELCTEYIDLHWEIDQIYAEEQQREDTSSEQDAGHSAPNGFAHHSSKAAPGKKAIRSNFSGSVTLSNGLSLTHWELADDIALIARVGSSVLNQAPAVVESNVQHFREAVLQIRELEQER